MQDWDQTIVALSTPVGQGAVSVVRLSGSDAVAIASAFTSVVGEGGLSGTTPRLLVNAIIRIAGDVWDRCLVVRFEAPRSFTGEDVVELHLHGNPLIVERVIAAAVEHGARPAQAGEFTMRAVLNGKLDLVQAEALGEAIAAESANAVRIAQRQLGGELSRRFAELRRRVVEAVARLELELDFAEEGYAFVSDAELRELVADLRRTVDALLGNLRAGESLRTGPRVLLMGRPNAGKSSFFNSVLGYARSIVSDEAGTTRDYLEERVVRSGRVLRIVDTAGLRDATNAVEAAGVARSRSLAVGASAILYLVDASDRAAVEAADVELADVASWNPDAVVVPVWTKVDRGWFVPDDAISCSALSSESVMAVLDVLVARLSPVGEDIAALVSARQGLLLEEMDRILSTAVASWSAGVGAELVSADLRRLFGPLASLTGSIDNESVLDSVFGSFCIGK